MTFPKQPIWLKGGLVPFCIKRRKRIVKARARAGRLRALRGAGAVRAGYVT